ncbi:hypothetical protein CLOM_g8962 [Closterium sp. NIES-68]|nr:hypothetical protein CLOM_g8962 [Closterium sp. NIES-68]GJP84824.1 hypothetical protein CLOP_g14874 [Closterium sp. NIES-67]
MQSEYESRSPSLDLPTENQDVPILVSRYHDAAADDDDLDGTDIVNSTRTVADEARAVNGVRPHWSDTEVMQLVRAFVELDREIDLRRVIHGSNYYRELHSLIVHKHPDFRHSQGAVKSKLLRMKNNYYRLQNRLERSAVSRTDPLPEWYVMMDSVMERDTYNWREAIPMGPARENRLEARHALPSRSRGVVAAAAAAVAKEESAKGDSSGKDLAPSNDTPAYAFPALPSLPTAAGANSLRYASPTARGSSATYAATTAAAPATVAAPSSVSAPTTAVATSVAARSVAALPTTPAPAASKALAPATVMAPATATAPSPAAGESGGSYLQSLRAATIPPAAQGGRLVSPPSNQNERRMSPSSARDGMRMSPPSAGRLVTPSSARNAGRMPPSSAQEGRRVAAAGGPAGWRGRRGWAWRERDDAETGNADYMTAAESLGAAMDEAVENAFADFQGMTQEWVESACAEFEGLVAEMAEKACFQFRSAAREFSEAWKAGQDHKRRRRY